jgi:hypothetical protein
LVVSVGVKLAVIVDVPTPANVRVDPLTVATAVFDEEYANDPAVSAVGAVMVCAVSPTAALTLLKAPSVGVDKVDPVTDMPKYWPAQAPESEDHELPLFDDDSAVNVGVGVTLVVGVAALHFQPIVPPAEPVRTTKYWVLAARVRGLPSV